MAAQNFANFALEGNDPRRPSLDVQEQKQPPAYNTEYGHEASHNNGFSIEQAHVHNDTSILFEEYLHYAKITRDAESHYESGRPQKKGQWNLLGILKARFSKGDVYNQERDAQPTTGDEKATNVPDAQAGETHYDFSTVSDQEWRTASRATRTASWSVVFFLITTDILGPTGAPWAFANTGYAPGVALYTTFGLLASLSGWYIWSVFMYTDSDRYPLRDFGQAFFRVYGQGMRHLINVLQSVQMLMLVAVLVLSLGGSVSQVSLGKDGKNGNGLCFIVCLLIIALLGMLLGQIRTLQRFGWLANLSVWTTVIVCFMAIGVAATSAPNYDVMFSSFGSGGVPFGNVNFPDGTVDSHIPVVKFAGSPPAGYASGGNGFLGTYAGINTIIYSYGGAMIFFNLLAEMRNPWDFWKGMVVADIFIYLVYMFFGLFQYSYQGQYTYSTAIQSITPYNYQTAGNILSIVGGLIAAALYGNIGIKVVYNNVFVELLRFPALSTKRGKFMWALIVPMYWALAFIVAGAVPELGQLTSLVGAFCIGNFTYAFPAILKIGFDIKRGAMLPEESFDPVTRRYTRLDNGMKRWVRGFKKTWMLSTLNILYTMGALTVCGLGMYSAIESLITAFGGGSVATSFTCVSPYAA